MLAGSDEKGQLEAGIGCGAYVRGLVNGVGPHGEIQGEIGARSYRVEGVSEFTEVFACHDYRSLGKRLVSLTT